MRRIALSDGKPLKISGENRVRLKQWLIEEHRKAIDARAGLEQTWRTCLRMYQGSLPSDDKRWLPFEGAPVIEVTVGALCTDAVYAQAIDLIFQVKNPVTVLPAPGNKDQKDESIAAVQAYMDHGVSKGFNFKPAVKEGLLDDTQLGTFVFYIPWTRTVRKTGVMTIETQGPKIYALDPKDFILPPRSPKNIQDAKWCTARFWFSKTEVNLAGRMQNWTIDDANAVSDTSDPVGGDRLKLAGIRSSGNDQKKPYAIGLTYGYFDVDGDGIDEDIEVTWNMTTGGILKVCWNTYDIRPFELECYQDRAHVAYGIGVMEMVVPFEMELTEIHNNRIWNMMIANTKMYQGPEAAMGEATEIYPGKYIPNDSGPITVLDMGQVNNAPVQAEMQAMSMAEKRVGTNELSAPARLGGRTPGITALSALQQANRRFTPAFQNMRDGVAGAVIQCLYRLQERIRAVPGEERGMPDKHAIIEDLYKMIGEDHARVLVDLLSQEDELTNAIGIELTASSVSVNREADRQNMMLLSQVYEKYMQGMSMLAQTKAAPPFPGADKIADEAAQALNKLMRKILRTFEQVSDVDGFLIDLDAVQPQMNPLMQQMNGLAGQMQPGAEQNGAQPQGPMQ